jgi:DNA-binding IclR family transcriptional regulator
MRNTSLSPVGTTRRPQRRPGPGELVPRTDTGVGVLDRSIQIIEAVHGGAHSLRAIARATGLPVATAHRLFQSLERHGFVARGSGLGYRLGPRLLQLSAAALQDLPLRDLAHPILKELATATGESAQLYVRSPDGRLCIDAVQSTNELRAFVEIGAELPISVGSAGKIFLAWMAEPQRSKLIREAKKLTDDTPTGERLERQVASARRTGWASSAGERQSGVGSVSAPVRGIGEGLAAVVSIAGPGTRITKIGAKGYAPAVTRAARDIERAIGSAVGSD